MAKKKNVQTPQFPADAPTYNQAGPYGNGSLFQTIRASLPSVQDIFGVQPVASGNLKPGPSQKAVTPVAPAAKPAPAPKVIQQPAPVKPAVAAPTAPTSGNWLQNMFGVTPVASGNLTPGPGQKAITPMAPAVVAAAPVPAPVAKVAAPAAHAVPAPASGNWLQNLLGVQPVASGNLTPGPGQRSVTPVPPANAPTYNAAAAIPASVTAPKPAAAVPQPPVWTPPVFQGLMPSQAAPPAPVRQPVQPSSPVVAAAKPSLPGSPPRPVPSTPPGKTFKTQAVQPTASPPPADPGLNGWQEIFPGTATGGLTETFNGSVPKIPDVLNSSNFRQTPGQVNDYILSPQGEAEAKRMGIYQSAVNAFQSQRDKVVGSETISSPSPVGTLPDVPQFDFGKMLGDFGHNLTAPNDALGGARPLSLILGGLAQLADRQGQPGQALVNTTQGMENIFNADFNREQKAQETKNATTQVGEQIRHNKASEFLNKYQVDKGLWDSSQGRALQLNLAKMQIKSQADLASLDNASRLQIAKLSAAVSVRQQNIQAQHFKLSYEAAMAKVGKTGAVDNLASIAAVKLVNSNDADRAQGIRQLQKMDSGDGKTTLFDQLWKQAKVDLVEQLGSLQVATSSWDGKTEITTEAAQAFRKAETGGKLTPEEAKLAEAVRKDLQTRTLAIAKGMYEINHPPKTGAASNSNPTEDPMAAIMRYAQDQ